MDFEFKVIKKEKSTKARNGQILTPHGVIQTPAFALVGTKASVKSLTPEDLKETGSQVVLANAYHLYLQPGTQVLEKFGGFAPFMCWEGPTITDSGGYQVSFLWSKESGPRPMRATDYGVYFRSHLDGSKHFLSPEKSMQIQHSLAADIIMAFDQPLGFGISKAQTKEACERTLRWEERSFVEWQNLEKKRKTGTPQALFGIIQGQTDKKIRRQFLDFVIKTGFPGIAIGDQSIGVDPQLTARALDTIVDFLPDNKPLHALGLGGGPEGIFEAVQRGVDIFDNSSVTRMARSGLMFIYREDGGNPVNKFRRNLLHSSFVGSKEHPSKVCSCYSCMNFSLGYLSHLFRARELLGLRLATLHNIFFINYLLEQMRTAIQDGDFLNLKKEWLKRN